MKIALCKKKEKFAVCTLQAHRLQAYKFKQNSFEFASQECNLIILQYFQSN